MPAARSGLSVAAAKVPPPVFHLDNPSPGVAIRLFAFFLRTSAGYHQVWTVAEMAKRANLSEARFSALYRKIFGTSPNDELIRARGEHAQFLLAHTSLPIKAVAGRCGFESVPYFSRAFHRRVGCAPRDYLRVPLKLAGG